MWIAGTAGIAAWATFLPRRRCRLPAFLRIPVYFALSFPTGAVLVDRFLRYTLDPADMIDWLPPMSTVAAAFPVEERPTRQLESGGAVRWIVAVTRHDRLRGWNAAHGLPRQDEWAVARGAVYVYRFEGTPGENETGSLSGLPPCPRMGVGLRRNEGFGVAVVSDDFHRRFHTQEAHAVHVLSSELIRKVDRYTDEHHGTFTSLRGRKFFRQFGADNKTQVRNLQQIACSATRFADIEDFVKNQMGKGNKHWKALGKRRASAARTIAQPQPGARPRFCRPASGASTPRPRLGARCGWRIPVSARVEGDGRRRMRSADLLSDTVYREEACRQLDDLLQDCQRFPVEKSQLDGLRQIAPAAAGKGQGGSRGTQRERAERKFGECLQEVGKAESQPASGNRLLDAGGAVSAIRPPIGRFTERVSNTLLKSSGRRTFPQSAPA